MSISKIITKVPFLNVPLRFIGSRYNAFVQPIVSGFCNKHIRALKDSHKGERCFIVATGPSLTVEDLQLLKKEVCFSCNGIVKWFDRTDWRPDYYMMFDKDVYMKLKTDIEHNANNLPNFYHPYDWDFKGEISRPYILKRTSWYTASEYFFLCKYMGWKVGFSKDVSRFINRGGNVVHSIMQLVYYMGFKEVYLLGCDCNFLGDNIHAAGMDYKLSGNTDGAFLNHLILEDYKKDKEIFEADGRKIFNATRGGKLELFERVELKDVIYN